MPNCRLTKIEVQLWKGLGSIVLIVNETVARGHRLLRFVTLIPTLISEILISDT